ncbi:hypothetical protein PoB_005215000 [Plakobranchus ocellatus]|uniref:Uncharacterized protein n=1 Tax=Plakobranchus ocellatus TaxID=259542 RepID=A0AAV4BZ02_9GAST|nr:hypothetical protein PoB_005215000 [Plakobranchus ocellatus]
MDKEADRQKEIQSHRDVYTRRMDKDADRQKEIQSYRDVYTTRMDKDADRQKEIQSYRDVYTTRMDKEVSGLPGRVRSLSKYRRSPQSGYRLGHVRQTTGIESATNSSYTRCIETANSRLLPASPVLCNVRISAIR